MATQYTKQLKEDSLKYGKEHLELGICKCTKNLNISKSALCVWGKMYEDNAGDVPTRGNFESDEVKEIANFRKELRDTQDALDILKKVIDILRK